MFYRAFLIKTYLYFFKACSLYHLLLYLASLEVNFHYVFRDIAGTAGNIHVKVKMTMDKGVRTCGI